MKKHIQSLVFIFILLFTTAAGAQENGYVTHTVKRGQTLFSISKMYDTTVETIIKHNPESAKSLSTGQTLRIPKGNRSTGQGEDVKRDGKLYHTIRSKETLFSLGKRYGVTPDEICAANPGLSIDNFPVGKEIVIPQKEPSFRFTPVKETKNPSFRLEILEDEEKTPEIVGTHKVKRRETIEKICRKYDVRVEDFMKVNPQLEGKKVKRKMIVNIPAKYVAPQAKKPAVKEEEPIATDVIPARPARSDDGVTRIAVVLPFLLDRFAPEEQGRMVEFYQGLLMAVEKLKRENYSFEVNTFDSGFKDKSLGALIGSGALDNMDLIIGAYYPEHNRQLGRFAAEKEIPLVVPFSNKQDELYNNPMVFFVNTLQSSIIPDVTKSFVNTFPDANVIFVEDTVKSNKGNFIKDLTAGLVKSGIPHTTIRMEEIVFDDDEETEEGEEPGFMTSLRSLAADSTRQNIIIPTSSSKETLNRILPSLVMANAIDTTLMGRYRLFGYPEWQIFAQQTREQMYEVDTYFYATFFSHFSMPQSARFQNDFIRWYNRDLQKMFPRYGMLGYDIGYYFIKAISMYGNDMPDKIETLDHTPIQTGFRFERIKENGAMMNKKLYFIHYTREYDIEKIDLDKCVE